MSRVVRLSVIGLSLVALTSVGFAPSASAEANLQGSAGGVSVQVRVDDGQMNGAACANASIDIRPTGNYRQLQVNLEAETPNSGNSLSANVMGYDSNNSIQDGFTLCPSDFLPGIYTVTGSIEVDGKEAPLTSGTFEVTSTTVKFANTKAAVKGSNLKVNGIVRYVSLLGAAPASGQVDISYRLPKNGGGFGKWQGLGSIGTDANGAYAMSQVGGMKSGAQVKVVFQGNDDTKGSTMVTAR
jgi:hypothetical protein